MKKAVTICGLLAAAALTIGAANYHNAQAEKEIPPQNTVEYVVLPGDTLWCIAGDYTPADKDIRETIYYIKMDNPEVINGLHAGQKLKIRTNTEEDIDGKND